MEFHNPKNILKIKLIKAGSKIVTIPQSIGNPIPRELKHKDSVIVYFLNGDIAPKVIEFEKYEEAKIYALSLMSKIGLIQI